MQAGQHRKEKTAAQKKKKKKKKKGGKKKNKTSLVRVAQSQGKASTQRLKKKEGIVNFRIETLPR